MKLLYFVIDSKLLALAVVLALFALALFALAEVSSLVALRQFVLQSSLA